MTSETLFQIVLAIGAALALWNKQRRAAAKKAGPARVSGNDEAMEAERRRRVQEDIRRKIAQRAARPAPLEAREEASQPPMVAEPTEPFTNGGPGRAPAGAFSPAGAAKFAPVAAPPGGPQPFSPIAASPFRKDLPPAPPAPTPDWLVELRDPSGVRRAILLREILSPPVGLKGSGR
jgi:hypothetical protein